MSDGTPLLFVAAYGDVVTASSDFRQLCLYQCNRELDGERSVDAVVLRRDLDGKVSASTDCGEDICPDAVFTGNTGLIIGLFAPPLLMAMMVGEGVGDNIKQLVQKHDEGQMGVDLDVYLPQGGCAIAVMAPREGLVGVEAMLVNAAAAARIAVDPDDCHTIEVALLEAGFRRGDASAA